MSFLLRPWTSQHPLSILGYCNSVLTGSAPSSLAHSAEAPHHTQNFLINPNLITSFSCVKACSVSVIAFKINSQSLTLSVLSNLFPLAFPSSHFQPCLLTSPSPWFCSVPTYYKPFLFKKDVVRKTELSPYFPIRLPASPSGSQLRGRGMGNVTRGFSNGKGVMDCPY